MPPRKKPIRRVAARAGSNQPVQDVPSSMDDVTEDPIASLPLSPKKINQVSQTRNRLLRSGKAAVTHSPGAVDVQVPATRKGLAAAGRQQPRTRGQAQGRRTGSANQSITSNTHDQSLESETHTPINRERSKGGLSTRGGPRPDPAAVVDAGTSSTVDRKRATTRKVYSAHREIHRNRALTIIFRGRESHAYPRTRRLSMRITMMPAPPPIRPLHLSPKVLFKTQTSLLTRSVDPKLRSLAGASLDAFQTPLKRSLRLDRLLGRWLLGHYRKHHAAKCLSTAPSRITSPTLRRFRLSRPPQLSPLDDRCQCRGEAPLLMSSTHYQRHHAPIVL